MLHSGTYVVRSTNHPARLQKRLKELPLSNRPYTLAQEGSRGGRLVGVEDLELEIPKERVLVTTDRLDKTATNLPQRKRTSLSARKRKIFFLSAFITALICPHVWGLSYSAMALSSESGQAQYSGSSERGSLRFIPIDLADGSHLTLISPHHWSDIAEEILQELTQTHQRLGELFGSIPPFRSSIRLMDERAFYELTGAPGWTNAMFFRGEIIIPLSQAQPIDLDNIHRSVKHEYTHAVLSALSHGSIPGWIDEGLAQWIEGDENPALRNTLKQYLHKHQPVSLSLLQGGFTKLEPTMVPAAYAQSLLAVQAMINAYGLPKIATYLSLLREAREKEDAFRMAFKISTTEFERRLGATLVTWASGTKRDKAPAQSTINGSRAMQKTSLR